MDCKEVQTLIPLYIKNKLTPKKMEAFLKHIRECQNCHDDLETYYIIHHAVKYLDEDKYVDYNMINMLHEDIRIKTKKVKAYNRMKMAAVYVGILFVMALLAFIGILMSPDESLRSLFHIVTI